MDLDPVDLLGQRSDTTVTYIYMYHIYKEFDNQCTISNFYNFPSYFLLASNAIKYLQAAPVNIIIGSHVWVEDPSLAWIDGEVIKINGQELHVHTTKGKTVSVFQEKTFINRISYNDNQHWRLAPVLINIINTTSHFLSHIAQFFSMLNKLF